MPTNYVMEENTRLSVIIPVYNVEKYIERCTLSLMNQTLKHGIEFLFINDCTPDHSVDIIRNIVDKYPERRSQVRIIDMPVNSGQGAVRNRGMHEAQGEYIIHCDSDDWVEFDMYEILLNQADEKNADMVVTDFFIEYADHQEIEVYPDTSIKESILLGQKIWWSLCTRIVRKKLFIEHDIYPISGINVMEDFLVLNKATYHANKIEYIHKPLYHYNRTNENSILKEDNNERNFYYIAIVAEDLYRYFHKGKEKWAKGYFSDFYDNIQKIKIAKRDWLLLKEHYDIKRWKKTFPGTWPYMLRNKERSFAYRICYVLADFGLTLPLQCYCYIKNK